jgi:hypothetical protein
MMEVSPELPRTLAVHVPSYFYDDVHIRGKLSSPNVEKLESIVNGLVLRVAALEKRLSDSEARVETLWYCPEMPGFVSARDRWAASKNGIRPSQE